MKTSLSLLLASTAMALAIGLPAVAAMRPSGDASDLCGPSVCAAVFDGTDQTAPLIRVSGDDDDDDDDDDADCDDEDDCTGAQGNPAPAGTVLPPANGLFGDGAPPVVITN